MNRWHFLSRAGRMQETSRPGCPHCGRPLLTCPACGGRYDTGRLCQACMYGQVCPACARYWTWN